MGALGTERAWECLERRERHTALVDEVRERLQEPGQVGPWRPVARSLDGILSAKESHGGIRREGTTTQDLTAVCPPVQRLSKAIFSLSQLGRALNTESPCPGMQPELWEPQEDGRLAEALALVLSPRSPYGRLACFQEGDV